ncbi:hypothetical protein AB0C34_20235 [Nocardia sp. NPDC049220]|uniref:hypothetical protein n=1 Tax=Nocardia sp. NPDC049220 TaxID=3155273 RepID=UPI00340B2513
MTGCDPDYIGSMEHFESMRHEQIYAKAQQIDAAQVSRASATWLEVAGALATSFPLTKGSVDRVLNSMRWQGATADAAYASARSFAASVDELAAVMGEVGARLGGVAAAAEAVKLAAVPPGNSGPIGTVAKLLEAARVIDAQMAQEALRQEAVLAMNMVYKPAYSAAGTAVPALPDPPEPPGVRSGPVTPQASAPSTPKYKTPEQVGPDSRSTPDTPRPTPAPESPAPSHGSAPGGQPQPVPQPTPSMPPPQQSSPSERTPSTQPAPAPQPAPEPTPQTQPAPPPPPVLTPPPPSPPPAPAIPEPARPVHPPIPSPAEPPVPLPDPGGQPGVTGPVQDNQNQAPTTNQPGVVPS